MVNFAIPEFNKAVEEFQKIFATHPRLYRSGQFYLTDYILDQIIGVADDEIKRNIRFIINPAYGDQIIRGLKGCIAHIPLPLLNLEFIDKILASAEVDGDLAALRSMFSSAPPEISETRSVQAAYKSVWDKPSIGGPPYLGAYPNMKMARAAFAFEKDKCFSTCRSLANKLLTARKISTLPKNLKISNGKIAEATLTGKPAGEGPIVEQQILAYNLPSQLVKETKAMRKAIEAGAVIQCGVLSGARLDKNLRQEPEHYILVFAYGIVEGIDAFLFWDPDAHTTNIKTTTWGDGFGVIFYRPGRLSTSISDADLTRIDCNKNSSNFGNHLNEPNRHCYQVFYLQTLPL
jgi:hypothetical protein